MLMNNTAAAAESHGHVSLCCVNWRHHRGRVRAAEAGALTRAPTTTHVAGAAS